MPQFRCEVPYCKNRSAKQPHLGFFRFPSDPKRLLQWLNACGEPELAAIPMRFLQQRRICEDHFKLCLISKNLTKRALKRDAVPSVFQEGHTFLSGEDLDIELAECALDKIVSASTQTPVSKDSFVGIEENVTQGVSVETPPETPSDNSESYESISASTQIPVSSVGTEENFIQEVIIDSPQETSLVNSQSHEEHMVTALIVESAQHTSIQEENLTQTIVLEALQSTPPTGDSSPINPFPNSPSDRTFDTAGCKLLSLNQLSVKSFVKENQKMWMLCAGNEGFVLKPGEKLVLFENCGP